MPSLRWQGAFPVDGWGWLNRDENPRAKGAQRQRFACALDGERHGRNVQRVAAGCVRSYLENGMVSVTIRPPRHARRGANGAVVTLDDVTGTGETEAGVSGSRAEEGIAEARPFRFRDARPVVFDAAPTAVAARALVRRTQDIGPNSVVGDRLHRVAHDVHQRFLEQDAIAFHLEPLRSRAVTASAATCEFGCHRVAAASSTSQRSGKRSRAEPSGRVTRRNAFNGFAERSVSFWSASSDARSARSTSPDRSCARTRACP